VALGKLNFVFWQHVGFSGVLFFVFSDRQAHMYQWQKKCSCESFAKFLRILNV